MNVLVWLKRDLRAHDHPALGLAAGLGPVLPVYVVEPELWSQPEASGRQWDFVAESLEDLRGELAGMGLPLLVRVGDAVMVLERLCRQHRISRVISHEETGTPWTRARDRRVAVWARGMGVEWTELPQPGLTGAMMLPSAFTAVQGVEPGAIPTTRALKLAEDRCPHRQLGGRARGLDLLDSFLTRRGEAYQITPSSPLCAERASSRLSPHLAWGTLSAREVAHTATARQIERPGGRWTGALAGFQSRLVLRDQVPTAGAETPRPSPHDADASRLPAWANGKTGLPFLDACLRYLAATGWLTARLRTMVGMVGSCHLQLDWRTVGQHLARQFTDYDPGLHWPEVERFAGIGGPTPSRLINPVRQGQIMDPTGAFIRAWAPELAPVPDAFLHEPWKWPEARRGLGGRYPEPIIDLASAARAARQALGSARKPPGFAESAPRSIARRFPARPSVQLSLDL